LLDNNILSSNIASLSLIVLLHVAIASCGQKPGQPYFQQLQWRRRSGHTVENLRNFFPCLSSDNPCIPANSYISHNLDVLRQDLMTCSLSLSLNAAASLRLHIAVAFSPYLTAPDLAFFRLLKPLY
jgi:hypothetical protein